MPSELRHLVFKPAEVVEAILAQRRAGRKDTPAGSVVDSGIRESSEGAPPGFGVKIIPDRGDQTPFEILVEGADLISTLLLYCRNPSIPVPMRGSKGLVRFGSRLGLVVTIG